MRVSTQELSAQDIEVLPVREALQLNGNHLHNIITTINAAVALPGAGASSANATQTSVVLLGGGAGSEPDMSDSDY